MGEHRVVRLLLLALTLLPMIACSSDHGQCLNVVRNIYSSSGLRAKISPNIIGNWTSTGCEVRHGGTFLVRSFAFSPFGGWRALFHHYTDWLCSEPSFTLALQGHYHTIGESIKLKGGTNAFFNFTRIELYSHTQSVTTKILNIAKRSCAGTVKRLSNTFSDAFTVEQRAFGKRSCRKAFGISVYELMLLRLESYSALGRKHDKLFFAEIPTDPKAKRKYTPQGYQMPLMRYNAPNCSLCTAINSASAKNPPKLSKTSLPTASQLTGQWGSTTCETRPKETFLTRYLTTSAKTGKWEGSFFFYLDADCVSLAYILYCKGAFSGGKFSSIVPGGMMYTFMVTEAKLTVFDTGTVGVLNSARDKTCGTPGEWKRGVEHDITPTQGCSFLGIKLPHTEYDLITVRKNPMGQMELFMGQRPSNGGNPDSHEKRPSSYQIPLLRCSAIPYTYVKTTTAPTVPVTRFKYPDVFTLSTENLQKRTNNDNDVNNKESIDIMAFESSASKSWAQLTLVLVSLAAAIYLY